MTDLSGVVEMDQHEMDRSWSAATRAVFGARDDGCADAKEKLLILVHMETHVLPGDL